MYAMQLLQYGLGMARYVRGLAQPAVDIFGAISLYAYSPRVWWRH